MSTTSVILSDSARIVAHAEPRFFAQGFHTITMDDLARDLGMSKKTLYRHFPTKEALLDAVLDGFAERISTALGEILAAEEFSVAERLQRLLARIAELLAPLQPVFFLSLQRYAPRQAQRLEQLRRRNMERHLLPMLRRAAAQGQVRSDLEPTVAVELMLLVVHQALNPEVLDRLQCTPAQIVPRAVDLLFRGLLVPAPARGNASRPRGPAKPAARCTRLSPA